MHRHLYICMNVFTFLSIDIHVHAYMHLHMCIYIYEDMYMHLYHIHMYLRIQVVLGVRTPGLPLASSSASRTEPSPGQPIESSRWLSYGVDLESWQEALRDLGGYALNHIKDLYRIEGIHRKPMFYKFII